MRPRGLCDRINLFLEEGLVNDVFIATQFHLLKGPTAIESLSPASGLGMISERGVSPVEFIELLEQGRFSGVFTDASIFSIECTFDNGKIRTHRYTFIPCPFDNDLVSLRPESVPIADWLRYSVLPSGSAAFRSTGTYRFDCVRKPAEKSADPHPISHFTFGSPDCRVPVRGPLSIGDFLNFVFDNFYRDARPLWLTHAPFLDCDGTEPTITLDEQIVHHIQWLSP